MNENVVAQEIVKLAVSMTARDNHKVLPVKSKQVLVSTWIENPDDDPNAPSWTLFVTSQAGEGEQAWVARTENDLVLAASSIARYLNRGPELLPITYQKSVA